MTPIIEVDGIRQQVGPWNNGQQVTETRTVGQVSQLSRVSEQVERVNITQPAIGRNVIGVEEQAQILQTQPVQHQVIEHQAQVSNVPPGGMQMRGWEVATPVRAQPIGQYNVVQEPTVLEVIQQPIQQQQVVEFVQQPTIVGGTGFAVEQMPISTISQPAVFEQRTVGGTGFVQQGISTSVVQPVQTISTGQPLQTITQPGFVEVIQQQPMVEVIQQPVQSTLIQQPTTMIQQPQVLF